MKITKVTVNDLFDTFNHEIDFKYEAGITLILGQNGLGKTMVLKLIQAVFEGDFIFIQGVQFSSIRIDFLDNTSWEIKRIVSENNEELLLTRIENELDVEKISITDINQNYEKFRILLRKYLPDSIRKVDEDEWLDRRTEIRYSTKDLLVNYKDIIPKEVLNEYIIFPKWFHDIIDSCNVTLIETQRLLMLGNSTDDDFRYRRPLLNYRNTVEEYSDQLSKEINIQLANSSELATKLDRTYPNRLIERLKKTSNISQTELNEKLNELEIKRARLQKVGLLDLEKEPNLIYIKEQDEAIREVLLVYIEDSQQKLKVYDELTDKIELLLRIINESFLKKKLSISKDEGFHFESIKTGKPIPVKSLSSGEQHLLVLFYQFLFKLKKDTILLIDEPEISLHISWQKKFIFDLKDILKLNKMDVVIATHSPSIIVNNWDLTVELEA
jgi:predicted ATP-binding protein involved in virulence